MYAPPRKTRCSPGRRLTPGRTGIPRGRHTPRLILSWFETLTDVRPHEVRALVLMMLYGFLAITSYYVVKPVRNAVFVDRVGADNLPYVYILTAIVVSAIMVVYSRWVHRLGHKTLLLGTLAILMLTILVSTRARDMPTAAAGPALGWSRLRRERGGIGSVPAQHQEAAGQATGDGRDQLNQDGPEHDHRLADGHADR